MWLSIWNDDGLLFRDMKYVFNVHPRLLYVIFRFCKFTVPVLRFGVTNNTVQYVSVLFVLFSSIQYELFKQHSVDIII